ncbi:MAG: helix-turn-helix transcriptional regulator [Akkermansiaceae bacterium]|nr:helix-turn-helix transcriptional regulator [Armatimonadota bacterium]
MRAPKKIEPYYPDERELLRGNTPTMVLAVLRDGPLHGYAIAREVNRRTGDALRFKQGTLYAVLHALERDEWIAGNWETGDGERPRKVYAMTEAGQAELARRTVVWDRFAKAMARVIGDVTEEPNASQPA